MSIEISHTRRVYGFQVKSNLTEFRVKPGLMGWGSGITLATEHGVESVKNSATNISKALFNAGFYSGKIKVAELNFDVLNPLIKRRGTDDPNAQRADENCLPAIAAIIGEPEDVFETKPSEATTQAEKELVRELKEYFDLAKAGDVEIAITLDHLTVPLLTKIFLTTYKARKLAFESLQTLFKKISDKDRKFLLGMMSDREQRILENALRGKGG
jgi:hypothetical protein